MFACSDRASVRRRSPCVEHMYTRSVLKFRAGAGARDSRGREVEKVAKYYVTQGATRTSRATPGHSSLQQSGSSMVRSQQTSGLPLRSTPVVAGALHSSEARCGLCLSGERCCAPRTQYRYPIRRQGLSCCPLSAPSRLDTAPHTHVIHKLSAAARPLAPRKTRGHAPPNPWQQN